LITLASGGHFSAVLFLPVVAIVICDMGGARRWGITRSLVLLFLVAVTLLPFFQWQAPLKDALWMRAALGALLAALALAWHPPRWLNSELSLRLALPALFLGAVAFAVLQPRRNPISGLLMHLDVLGHEAYRYNGMVREPGPALLTYVTPVLAAAFLLGELARVARLSSERKTLLLWCAIPVLGVYGGWLQIGRVPEQWLNVVFPTTWVFCAAPLLGLRKAIPWRALRPAPVFAVFGLVLVQAWNAERVEAFIAKEGGIYSHTASLNVKEAVIEKIRAAEANPVVVLMLNEWREPHDYDIEAWRFLAGRFSAGAPPRGRAFYILEPRGGLYEPAFLETLRNSPGFRLDTIGPVILASTDRFVGGAGLRIR
jgi:hypothetical protein